MIAGYLGRSDQGWTRRCAASPGAYADQTERDHAALVARRRAAALLPAETGI